MASAIRSGLERVAGSAMFAYGSIFLIQAKVLWGIWDHRDLTSGDTTSYFFDASRWAESFHLNPVWSPLYTGLWGSMQWVVHDAYAVTILHRVLIAIAASLLVLAVLRRLLSPGIAWALAVWWAILPINYDTLYEVHLFALIPELMAVLIALSWSGLRMRSAVFGVLLATALLVRNELVIAVAIWTGAWVAYELRRHREGDPTPSARLVRAFVLPILAVGLCVAAAILSFPERGQLRSSLEEKHTLNLCQVYAFGYEQRNSDYTASPWTACRPLMRRDFGEDEPSLTEATVANPGAIGEHLVWNAQLAIPGVQLLLFDRTSAGADRDPDYTPVRGGSTASLIGSILLAAFVLGGLALLWRDRGRWWRTWIGERAWGWLVLGSLAVTATFVMLTQRPRPSYLFALTVLILAVIGMCAMAYADRWPALKRLRAVVPLLALVIFLAIPRHYAAGYQTPQDGRPGHPIKDMVDRLEPFSDQFRGSEVRLLGTYANVACFYLGRASPCHALSWRGLIGGSGEGSAAQESDRAGVDFVYADRSDLRDPAIQAAVRGLESDGWRRLSPAPAAADWVLLRRDAPVS